MIDLRLYEQKDKTYFAVAQEWVVDLLDGIPRILDIGCGDGATGAYLKRVGKAYEVHGVELVPSAARRAQVVLDSVIVGDIEKTTLPYPYGSFDCIIATEVLEHLFDPWQTIRQLTLYLRPGGYIIASVPNVRHIRVLWDLVIRGRWEYSDFGTLDRTHLRFFTLSSFVGLFTQAGLAVETVLPLMYPRSSRLNRVSVGLLAEFLTHRYACKAVKPLPGHSKC